MTEPRDVRTTEIDRASTLELFLDLVFVFTVTQLTEFVTDPHGLGDYGKALLILSITFWMYDGYVWLTGNVVMDRPAYRGAIFLGMGGYLLMAMAIPGSFGDGAHGDSGIVFGLAFLLVTLVHAAMFTTAPNASARAIRGIAPFNIGAAALLVIGGLGEPQWRWVWWLAAILLVTSSSVFGRERGFTISAVHFVERHGLVIIVALGESIVAIGVGANGLEIDATLVLTAMLGLALSATLWWVYFDRDDEGAGAAMTALIGHTRARMGLWVAYTHLAMVAGIVMMAAGVEPIVAHPTRTVGTATAWNLAAGVAVYLVAEAVFRIVLRVGRGGRRFAAAAAVLLTVPLGTGASGIAQLAAAVAVMIGLVTTSRRD